MARLRQIAPSETFDAEDQETINLEINLCKARLESSIFGGVTLWSSDSTIDDKIIEGFLMCLLPQVASHYQAITAPPEMTGEGYREICRQLTTPYDADTINDD